MAPPEPSAEGPEAHIRAYKAVLSRVLETRPSGARQRLADALGKHRSFVTQISSPSYSTPIPQKHLATIFSVCHFSPAERDGFMAAYQMAHPGRRRIGDATRRTRHLTLVVPDLGADNATFDKAVSEFVSRIAGLMKKNDDD